MAMYVQLTLLWSLIADRRTIVAGYARAYTIIKTQNEPNFSKLAQYLVNYADPYKRLRLLGFLHKC